LLRCSQVGAAVDDAAASDEASDAAVEAAEEAEPPGPLPGNFSRASSDGSGGHWGRDPTGTGSLHALLQQLSMQKTAEDLDGAVGGEAGEGHRVTLQRLTGSSSGSFHHGGMEALSGRWQGSTDGGAAGSRPLATRSAALVRTHSLQTRSTAGVGGGLRTTGSFEGEGGSAALMRSKSLQVIFTKHRSGSPTSGSPTSGSPTSGSANQTRL
jgi:hypothetical protein